MGDTLEAEFGPRPVITVYLDGPAKLICGVDDRGLCGGKLINRQMYRQAMFDCLPDGIHSATTKGVSAKIASSYRIHWIFLLQALILV